MLQLSAAAFSEPEIVTQQLALLTAAGVGFCNFDVDTGVGTWDALANQLFGLAFVPRNVEATPPIFAEDHRELLSALTCVIRGGPATPVEARVLGSTTPQRWVRITPTTHSIPNLSREIACLVTDITPEKIIEQELVESQRQLTTLINNLPGIAYRCEPHEPWHLSYVSHGVEELTGHRQIDFVRGKLSWADIVHPDDLRAVGEAVEAAVSSSRMFEMQYRIVKKSGDFRWVQERGRAVADEQGGNVCLEGFIGDITVSKLGEERARWLATHDCLTGLPNRLLFLEVLQKRIQCSVGSFAVLLLDLDDFKRINDTMGHDTGDQLLVEAVQRLQEALTPDDMAARLGGDEFAIILAEEGPGDERGGAAERVLKALRSPFKVEGQTVDCSASIGVSIFPDHGYSSSELLRHADIALYAAKAAGRDNLQFFQPNMRKVVQRRSTMISQARRAIDEDRILPYYQPKIRLASGEISGFEALLRWRQGSGPPQGPDQLSAALDDCALAPLLGARMLSAVTLDMRRWSDEGFEFGHVAINASPVQLRRGDFADVVLECLHASNIPSHRLQIEVTENVFLGRGTGCVERTLSTLSEAGATIALDDFGTGYASLTHLTQFPVDALKIDRSFVERLCISQESRAITQGVVQLGLNLALEIIAEGVETREQEALLKAAGCSVGQGFLYSRAVPALQVPSVGRRCGTIRSIF